MTIGVSHVREHRGTGAVQNQSIFLTIINVLHRLIVLLIRYVVKKKHGIHGQRVPVIDKTIHFESATSIAHKIRSQKVII